MKFSELKGRAVVSLEDASKIGEVQDLMIEPGTRRIISLKVKTGMFSSARLVPATDVKNVGADAVTISAHAVSAAGQEGNGNGSNGSTEGTQALVKLTGILGNKVVTDAGTFVGELHDILLEWVDLTITGYEVRESGMFAKTQEFAATPDVSYGDKMITIPAVLLNQPK
ncbi:MAG: PRC-barrel domain-containing protein [Chloroflexota bacterium]|nr:PRC-barrel domain-containing protein [Chloroflexota bacterium]MDQ5866198.1 PRC-barrel domain-containing protein [Chloroflexota bacterium]